MPQRNAPHEEDHKRMDVDKEQQDAEAMEEDEEEEMYDDDADEQEMTRRTTSSTAKDDDAYRRALRSILDGFTKEQMGRYEAFRRAGLPKASIKKFLQNVLGTSVQPSTAIICAGAGKLFVGELTERALDVQAARGESGPLQPGHLREALRTYRGSPSQKSHKKTLFS